MVTEETASAKPDAPRGAPSTAARWAKPVFGLAVSAVFVWLAFRGLSIAEIRVALAGVHWSFTPLALLCLAAGYSARITRWWIMLRPTAPELRWREAANPYLVSIAANNVLPLRIGDVLRLFAFRGRQGLEAARIGGTLLLERLLDLFVLLAIFALVLPAVPAFAASAELTRIAAIAAAAGAVALAILLLLPKLERLILHLLAGRSFVRHSTNATKLLGMFSGLVDTLARLSRPRRMAALALFSIVVWIMEGGVFLSAAHAMGIKLGLSGAAFALAVATLSTLLPSSPGYVGTFHFFAIQAALAFGAANADAAAFAIVVHLLLWAPTTFAGFLAFSLSSLSAREALTWK